MQIKTKTFVLISFAVTSSFCMAETNIKEGAAAHFCHSFSEKAFMAEPIPAPALSSIEGLRWRPIGPSKRDSEDIARRNALSMVDGKKPQTDASGGSDNLSKILSGIGKSEADIRSCEQFAKASVYAFQFSDGSTRRMEINRSGEQDLKLAPKAARVELWCDIAAPGKAPDVVAGLPLQSMPPKVRIANVCGGKAPARSDIVIVHKDGGWFVDSSFSPEQEAAYGNDFDRMKAGRFAPSDAADDSIVERF